MPNASFPVIRPHRHSRFLPCIAFLAAAIFIIGCGGCGGGTTGNANYIKGKVTLEGKPVSGTVIFVGSDKKEISSPTSVDGLYQIPNPPKGEGYFLVKGGLGAALPVEKGDKSGKGAKAKDEKTDLTGKVTGPTSGEAPPKKYEQKDNGLPKVNYTSGEVLQDLTLTP
jgi:hypothetical protein